jgi:hypothetical protein
MYVAQHGADQYTKRRDDRSACVEVGRDAERKAVLKV